MQELSRTDIGYAGLLQPATAGLLAAVVGFASSFAIVLQGLSAVGATPAQAASGLAALCLAQALLTIGLSSWLRMPISIAWSTPGAALLIGTGMPVGGFAAAVGAFMVAGAMVVAAGLWRPFGRTVSSIPASIASGMLAGVLLDLCLAPMRAVGAMPMLALPIVIAWAVMMRVSRLYAVPVAVLVTAVVIGFGTTLPQGIWMQVWPQPTLIAPVFTLDAAIGIALPLFIVTMASQNVPGLAVLSVNGFRPPVAPLFVATGLASAGLCLFGGHAVNLAAITAALCASPDAHPNPGKRYLAAVISGGAYLNLALVSGLAAAFVAASPPLLIQTAAGLALMGSLGAALTGALAREEERIPALVTFATTASGLSFFGIGAAFWGLVAGLAMLVFVRPLRS